MEIGKSLSDLIKSTPGVTSIFLTDRDGVPVVSAGEDQRSRASFISCYQSTFEQANKLEMGTQKAGIYLYDHRQVVVMNLSPMVLYVIASAETNTGVLLKMGKAIEPLLEQIEKLINDFP